MTDLAPELDRLARETSMDALPELLGAVVAAEARIRLRLAEPVTAAAVPERLLTAEEAAAIAGTSARWLLAATRGRAFRADLSRKRPRFREDGLRSWLAGRRR